MSRLYYELQTNITGLKEYIASPCLDEAIFRTKDGTFLEVECLGAEDYGWKNGFLKGTVKGDISYRHSVDLVNEITDWTKVDISSPELRTFAELMTGAELIGFRIDEERLCEHRIPKNFDICAESMDVAIVLDNLEFTLHADNPLSETKLEASIQELCLGM